MSDLARTLTQDMAANRGNPKGALVVLLFRLTHAARGSSNPWWSRPISTVYRTIIECLLGIELPPGVKAGPGLVTWHGVGRVVHASSVLDDHVTLRHGVMLGATAGGQDSPSHIGVTG